VLGASSSPCSVRRARSAAVGIRRTCRADPSRSGAFSRTCRRQILINLSQSSAPDGQPPCRSPANPAPPPTGVDGHQNLPARGHEQLPRGGQPRHEGDCSLCADVPEARSARLGLLRALARYPLGSVDLLRPLRPRELSARSRCADDLIDLDRSRVRAASARSPRSARRSPANQPSLDCRPLRPVGGADFPSGSLGPSTASSTEDRQATRSWKRETRRAVSRTTLTCGPGRCAKGY
jgi:hypothetical protein